MLTVGRGVLECIYGWHLHACAEAKCMLVEGQSTCAFSWQAVRVGGVGWVRECMQGRQEICLRDPVLPWPWTSTGPQTGDWGPLL